MKTKLKSETIEPDKVNLTLPLVGIPATQFNKIKTQIRVNANTEATRLILLPALALIHKIGFKAYLEIMEQHGAIDPAGTRTT